MKTIVCIALCMISCSATLLGASGPALSSKYVFTDTSVDIVLSGRVDEVAYEMKTITRDGWGPTGNGKVPVKDGTIHLQPLAEGIHIVSLKTDPPAELRFLALTPPPPIDKKVMRRSLPRSAGKLLKGKPFTILAMGDSVTATGEFENMLAMMLARATGNKSITVVDRSYPGRSIDASVRNFENDAISNKPDLAVIMYGLNDQAAGCPLDGYLDQYEWLARHLADDCGADPVFLQPTPHIDIPVNKENAKPDANPPEYAFRTIGFAKSVSQLADRLKLPCAETFQAIWGDGGATIEASAEKLWPLYPSSYSKPFISMIETDGKGDTIHPNALGHLMIARAVYNAIARPIVPEPLEKKAVSTWTDSGVKSTLSLSNRSDKTLTGKLAVYSRLECEPVALQGSGDYNLKPGETASFTVDWPEAQKPGDLLKYPAITALAPGTPILSTLLFSEGHTYVSGIPAPFGTPSFQRERLVATTPKVQVRLDNGERVDVDLPADKDHGRIPLIRTVTNGYAVAELAFCRYAAALKGEATVDGEDKEWAGHAWAGVGDPSQARWTRGMEDKRASPDECRLQWSMKAGGQGLFLAIRATGTVETDNFMLFFDTRQPEFLGTPGPYYWVSGNKGKEGRFSVSKGETSRKATGLAGKWSKTDTGAFVELFIPYELMDRTSWPQSGDLGFSLWWTHRGSAGVTQLLWSEDGHPWSPRWYGVIRLEKQPGQALPWMVRVK